MSGKYDQAIVLLRKMLRQSPDCHWGWFELSSAYYEKKKYILALRYAQKSLAIEPNCPLALWHCAGALSHTASILGIEENFQKSYDIYKKLLKKGVAGLDKMDCCNEGHNDNLGLINDCRLAVGMCAYGMNKYKEAKRWTNLFISKHDKNSIYTKKFGIRVLKSIEKYEH
jgi:tetratricopeptide (TPR) repeat protein